MHPSNDPRTIPACRRCGTCCKKGGPCLHDTDRPLVESGVIPLAHLWTIRIGEMVHDPIAGTAHPAPDEIIKIKNRTGRGQTCLYFDESDNSCQIYLNRPLECRILTCWDTSEIERIYGRDRLNRKTVLLSIAGLWDLIAVHEKTCSVVEYTRLLETMRTKPAPELSRRLREMTAFDREIRTLTIEKSGIDPEILLFLFGRPLTTIQMRFFS